MNDLPAFISARLDERARSAQGADVIAWLTYLDADGELKYTTVGAVSAKNAPGSGADLADAPWCAAGKLLARPSFAVVVYDEREVLRDVAAMRAVLALYEGDNPAASPDWYAGIMEALYELAAAWSNHPGYRPEWKR